MTLVVLAAGMASRYGGLKQIDPITETGEFIIDFSIYDAYKAGFDRVIFVIKKENLEIFKETIGVRAERYLKVEYAFQEMSDIPEKYLSLVPERLKPFGTSHAVLAARDIINDNFAVINADDFYGRDAFVKLAAHLSSAKDSEKLDICMIGYVLKNTLTENGSVSRGVCEMSDKGTLIDITERTKIFSVNGGAEYEEDGVRTSLPVNSLVSMNCWGFTPAVFEHIANGFDKFLAKNPDPKAEYYLPTAVKEMIADDKAEVKVYETNAKWFGVTYKDDKPGVMAGIKGEIDAGVYPTPLWK